MSKRLTFDRWLDKYKPVKNHIDTNAACDGLMFETYGPEVEHVKKQPANLVWTLVDCDGRLYLCSGWHFVNRINYFIASVPFTKSQPAQVFYA